MSSDGCVPGQFWTVGRSLKYVLFTSSLDFNSQSILEEGICKKSPPGPFRDTAIFSAFVAIESLETIGSC